MKKKQEIKKESFEKKQRERKMEIIDLASERMIERLKELDREIEREIKLIKIQSVVSIENKSNQN